MECPFRVIAEASLSQERRGRGDWLPTECGSDCALWIERFGRCALAVDAYLKGQEDWQAEKETERLLKERTQ